MRERETETETELPVILTALKVLHCGFAFIYGCALCIPGSYRGQKKASGLMKLELQTVVSLHVGAGNQTWVLWKGSQCC